MTAYYLDTSIAVRVLLGQPARLAAWFDSITADPHSSFVSSRILQTELTRVLRREGLAVAMRADVLDHIAGVPLTEAVIAGAEAIVPHVKTLDALHLASVVATGLELTIATHDASMRQVAEQLGYATYDPVEEFAG